MLPPLGNSNHSVVSFELCVSFNQSPSLVSPTRPNFSWADWPGLCNYLSTVNWLNVFSSFTTVEQYWDRFYVSSVLGLTALSLVLLALKHTSVVKFYP